MDTNREAKGMGVFYLPCVPMGCRLQATGYRLWVLPDLRPRYLS